MLITLQLPFIDLRKFLPQPPAFVPKQAVSPRLDLELEDFINAAKKKHVRCFGRFLTLEHIPVFELTTKTYLPVGYPEDVQAQWEMLENIFDDEYLYACSKCGLRFDAKAKLELLEGKLEKPRVKVRALHFFPFDSADKRWSPCMRIEIGILYNVTEALSGQELAGALAEFLKLRVNVPVYRKDGAGSRARVKKKLQEDTLISQQKALAGLIVNSTTAQAEQMVHKEMVMPGEPMLTVHYFKDEIAGFPSNVIPLPKALTGNTEISHYRLNRGENIAVWLFELPSVGSKTRVASQKRETIRNNTIALMRYWSEFQANISLRNAVAADSFAFFKEGSNEKMQDYVNRTTKFLLSGDWHGASLGVFRNIIQAYRLAEPDEFSINSKTIRNFRKQIAEKLVRIARSKPDIFVCYSHADRDFLLPVQKALSPFVQTQQIVYFDDTFIGAGEQWAQKIKDSLETAAVVLLFVSPSFFKSEFIREIELPKITELYQKEKLSGIIPVLIRGKVPLKGFLSGLQFLNGDQPLARCSPGERRTLMAALTAKTSAFLSVS